MNTNTITISGTLARDPEIRYTREGRASTSLTVAVSHPPEEDPGHDTTAFFDVVCWEDLAECVALSMTKGMRVVVAGRLLQHSYETEEEADEEQPGEYRFKLEIVADDVGASMIGATVDVHKLPRS